MLPGDRVTDLDRFPEDINYNTGLTIGLSTQTIDYFGLRVAQVYYQSINPLDNAKLTEPIPIVFERYYYNWAENIAHPIGRTKRIYFYDDEGDLTTQYKLLPKEFYNVSDREDIVYRRRQTIVSWLIARSKELGLGDALEGFFASFKNECDRYIAYGDSSIINLVSTSNEPWMDAATNTEMGTVRGAISLCFNKALLATPNTEIDLFLNNYGYSS